MKIKISLAVIIAAIICPLQVLADDREQLTTIVVEGSPDRPGTFSAAPDSSGLKDTASLLHRVPGANVNRNGPLTGIAQYRGLFGNRINIKVNDANMKEVGPNSMDPPLSHIPASLSGSLKVFQGLAPVSSGIETIGGSMSVESRKGEFAQGDGIETSGGLSSGYGSVDGGVFGAVLGAVANKNHKLHISGSAEFGNDYYYKDNKKVVPTRYERLAYTGGYAFQNENHEAGINYTGNNTDDAGTPALPMDIVWIKGGVTDAYYNWNLDNGSQFRTKFFYQNMRHKMNNFSLRAAPTIEMGLMAGRQRNRQNRTTVEGGGLDLEYTLPVWTGDLSFGFNGDLSEHGAKITDPVGNPNFFINNFNDINRNRYSGFVEWTPEIFDNLSSEVGLRYTYVEENAGTVAFGGIPPGMLNNNITTLQNNFNNADRNQDFNLVDFVSKLNYTVNSSLNTEIGFAIKNRAPSYQELYLWLPLEATAGLADGRNYIGNLNLDQETAYQVELGFDWADYGFYFSERFFYHYVSDYIQGLPTNNTVAQMTSNMMANMVGNRSNTPVLEFSNIDAELIGTDLEAGYTINDNWRLDAGLNYVRGRRVGGGGGNLYRIAPLNGRMQLTFNHSGFMASVEGVLYARQDEVAQFNNEKPSAGYGLVNLRTSYEPIKGLLIGAGIENIADKEYAPHLSGTNRVGNNPDLARGEKVPFPGRNFYATLGYSW